MPVPQGRPVADAEDAWAAACEIGGPVVVKPQRRQPGQGRGGQHRDPRTGGGGLRRRAEYQLRPSWSNAILPGHDFRLLVVGGKLVAAARREPPHVIGDGVHTMRELVEQVNSDPRRGEGHATSLTKIRLDDIALRHLAQQGFNADSVPRKGTRVVLRNNANLSTGGTATDVTDDVHPEVAARAVAAAQMVGLDIAASTWCAKAC